MAYPTMPLQEKSTKEYKDVFYDSKRFRTIVLLWPPKPKEFESMA